MTFRVLLSRLKYNTWIEFAVGAIVLEKDEDIKRKAMINVCDTIKDNKSL